MNPDVPRYKTVSALPQGVRVIENEFIQLKDVRLAAKIWLPLVKDNEKVPCVLEYIPYRKRDGTVERDHRTHPYYAGHGIAGCRVDIRGSGESEGVLEDEYSVQELIDAYDVIEWIAQQPWCNGNVGMMGISWGGFNALQVAAMQPPSLKAIITLCSTDNRYTDDIHYIGGCTMVQHFGWSNEMLLYISQPPDPLLTGEKWRSVWKERLETNPVSLIEWLKHPAYDDYWKRGSVCECWSAVHLPVYAWGGWGDSYFNAVRRIVKGAAGVSKGVIGPWYHKYPHFAYPAPCVGFLQESLRWWEQWLNGKDNGCREDPLLTVYVLESEHPKPHHTERKGKWITLDSTVPQQYRTFHASSYNGVGRLSEELFQFASDESLTIHSPLYLGTSCGEWCIMRFGASAPLDQREDDAMSVCFDTEPLTKPLDVVGHALFSARVSCAGKNANFVVRLCDVFPDGTSARISWGVLNLAHRHGHEPEELAEMKPDLFEQIEVSLNDCAYTVPEGHRIRIALSTAYWPLVWPNALNPPVNVSMDSAEVKIPVFEGSAVEQRFGEAMCCPEFPVVQITEPEEERVIQRCIAADTVTMKVISDTGVYEYPELEHLQLRFRRVEEVTVNRNDPTSCNARAELSLSVERPGTDLRVSTKAFVQFRGDLNDWHINASQDAFDDDLLFSRKEWNEVVPRGFL